MWGTIFSASLRLLWAWLAGKLFGSKEEQLGKTEQQAVDLKADNAVLQKELAVQHPTEDATINRLEEGTF